MVEFNTSTRSSIKISEDVGHYELLINRGYQVTRETQRRGFPLLHSTMELQRISQVQIVFNADEYDMTLILQFHTIS